MSANNQKRRTAAKTNTPTAMRKIGALCGNRTRDLSLTKGVLYH